MAIWNFALATGATMGSVIGGYVAEDLSWRWNFGLAAIALGILWLGFVFFLPETVYIRDIRYNLDEQSHEDLSGGFEKNAEGDAVQADLDNIPEPPKLSYMQQLRPWSGKVYDHDSTSFAHSHANVRLLQNCFPSSSPILLSCHLLGDSMLWHISNMARRLRCHIGPSFRRTPVQFHCRSSWSHWVIILGIWYDCQYLRRTSL